MPKPNDWIVHRMDHQYASSRRWHVLPLADAIGHEFSATCWCQPTRDPDEPRIFIHHSADGREDFDRHAPYPKATRH